jgi:DNA-binding HxlR family transcriptional regulator
MKKRNIYYPVEVTLSVIGGRWKTVILFHLNNRVLRFGELKRFIPGVTQKMLTQQLREMERDGLIDRKVYAQVPPKVEYSLTEFGRSLRPILNLMCKWGSEHSKRLGHQLPRKTRKPEEKSEPDRA